MLLHSNGIRVKRSVSALFLLLNMLFCSELQALEQEFYPTSGGDQDQLSDFVFENTSMMSFRDAHKVLCRLNSLRDINIDDLVSCQLSLDASIAIISLKSGYELIEVKSTSVDVHYLGIRNGKHLVQLQLNQSDLIGVVISNLKNKHFMYNLQVE